MKLIFSSLIRKQKLNKKIIIRNISFQVKAFGAANVFKMLNELLQCFTVTNLKAAMDFF